MLLLLTLAQVCFVLSDSPVLAFSRQQTEDILKTFPRQPTDTHTYGISFHLKEGNLTLYRIDQSATPSQLFSN